MEVDEFEAVKVELKKAIEALSKSDDFDPTLMKKIKNICKKHDRNVVLAQKLLYIQLRRNHCVVRLNCVQIIDQLFQRSHSFRTSVIDDFQTYVDLTLGSDPAKPLPPPVSQNKKLRRESIKKIKEWHQKFGEGYKKLRLSFNFLKQIVDFDDLSLINDEERLKQRERQEKLARLWTERVRKVGEEIAEYEEDICNWVTRTDNLFLALEESESLGFAEEISGQHNILTRRLLPKSEAWLVTLTKAGQSTDQDLIRKVLDVKNKLSTYLTKFEALNLNFERVTEEVVKVKTEDIKIKTEKVSDDPTTWQATVKKVTGQDLNLNLELEDKHSLLPQAITEPIPGGSRDTIIPKIRLNDIQEPDRMIVDPERSRFWVSDHREGEVVSVGSAQVVSQFAGTSEPVKWSCRAKLISGKLCPRKDKVKCPLHGLIVARDEHGEVVEQSDEKINFDVAPKVKAKKKVMKSAEKWDETSRTRIEKKIFSKSSARRVAKDLAKYDKIRTKDKFSDQFNY